MRSIGPPLPSALRWQNPRMQLKAFSYNYLGDNVFVVFGRPFGHNTKAILYRNNIEIANTVDNPELFIQPCMFDQDHHTNLFFKDSWYKWLYIDKNVHRYQHYKYYVVWEHIDDGVVKERRSSREMEVEVGV